MTTGNCKGVTKSNLRILAHVLGLSPRVLGLEGSGNVDPPVARPDLRYEGGYANRIGTVTSGISILKDAYPGNRLIAQEDAVDDVLVLTTTLVDTDASQPEDGAMTTFSTCRNGIEKGHARCVKYEDVLGRAAGVSFVVHPDGVSSLHVVGRMRASKIRSIARILELDIEGWLPEEGDDAIADIAFEGDDGLASKAYAELIAPRPKKRTRGLLRMLGF